MFLSPLKKSFNASKSSSSTMDHENNGGSIDWKLYNNPHYSFSAQKLLSISTSSSKKSSEIEKAMAEIKDLKAELEHEKRMRRKAEEACERLMKELVEERKAREGANETCRSLSKENLNVDPKEVGKTRKECVENPHIKRGISGVEFFRATRAKRSAVKCGEGRGVSAANLECQRAQLRVLMRYRSCVGDGQNLVM